MQHRQQLLDIGEVQAGGRFVEDIQRLAGAALRQLARQLDALRLTAGERGGRLAEADVGQPDIHQGLQLARQRRHRVEELARFFDGHLQHFVDALALVLHFQRFAVIALALALIARHVDVRQEVHLNLDHPVALAGFTAPALDVEAETARRITAAARFRHAGEQLAHRGENAGVGGRVGARRAADRALIDVDHLVEMFQAGHFAERRRFGDGGAVELALSDRKQRIVDQRRFAGAGHAGDAGKQTNRQRQRHVLQVVAARAAQLQHLGRIGLHALRRNGDLALAAEELAGQRVRLRHDVVDGAFRHHLAAVYAGAGADVDHVVGGADGVFVMLHHDHRVAEVAQVDQRFQQALVVALVQADRRLIQYVHHAHQAGADLAGQTDALRFAAGERLRRAGQRQVVQADVHQEFQAIADLFQHFFGDLGALAAELHVLEEGHRMADAQIGDLRQRGVFDEHVARFFAQASAVARGARAVADELRQFFAHRAGFGLFIAALHVVQHAFERMTAHGGITAIVDVFEFDRLFAGAAQHRLLHVGAQGVERRFDIELIVLRQRAQHLEVIEVAAIPAADRAAGQRQLGVLHHAIRIEELLHAQAVAGWAGAGRVVEGKQARFQLAHAVAADRAGEVGGEQQLVRFLVVHVRHHRGAAGQLQRGFERFGQALRHVLAHLEPVDHHFDGVFLLQLQLRRIGQIAHFTVDARADIALGGQVFQRFGVLALAVFHHRRQQHQALAFRLAQHVIDHLADGLRRQRHMVIRAARLADAGEQQAQVVVDFGDGADRGSRVVRGGFLLDGDRRR
ncbi:Uncharacterised protein [Serratia marcescens]|nr:Uncharacterised protein [Serratia marcescens]